MEPTIARGDHIVADMWCYRARPPGRFEVAILKHENLLLVKRIIAVEGDTIEAKDNRVFINGQMIREAYVQHTGRATERIRTFEPIRIAKGQVFVMGDNRDVSYDSRMAEFGPVPVESIVGKPLFIYKSDADRTGRTLR